MINQQSSGSKPYGNNGCFSYPQQTRFDFLNRLSQFMQNPTAMLSTKYNIPQNLTDPNDILQHLISTGQVSQDQVNKIMQMRRFIR